MLNQLKLAKDTIKSRTRNRLQGGAFTPIKFNHSVDFNI